MFCDVKTHLRLWIWIGRLASTTLCKNYMGSLIVIKCSILPSTSIFTVKPCFSVSFGRLQTIFLNILCTILKTFLTTEGTRKMQMNWNHLKSLEEWSAFIKWKCWFNKMLKKCWKWQYVQMVWLCFTAVLEMSWLPRVSCIYQICTCLNNGCHG